MINIVCPYIINFYKNLIIILKDYNNITTLLLENTIYLVINNNTI